MSDQGRKAEALDAVKRAAHYNAHPSGIECRDIVRHFPFALGNMVKYLWRWRDKGTPVEDLQKAHWYLREEVERAEALRLQRAPLFGHTFYGYVAHELLRGSHLHIGDEKLGSYVGKLQAVANASCATQEHDLSLDPLFVFVTSLCLPLARLEAGDSRSLYHRPNAIFEESERAILAQLSLLGAAPKTARLFGENV